MFLLCIVGYFHTHKKIVYFKKNIFKNHLHSINLALFYPATYIELSERGFVGLCTVLVLRGSRLFASTFLLRLTAHDQPGHMDFNLQPNTLEEDYSI